MKPAQYVIQQFKGESVLARLLGVDISTISQWKIRKGLIPTRKQLKVLKLAKKMGLNVTAEHIVCGTDT